MIESKRTKEFREKMRAIANQQDVNKKLNLVYDWVKDSSIARPGFNTLIKGVMITAFINAKQKQIDDMINAGSKWYIIVDQEYDYRIIHKGRMTYNQAVDKCNEYKKMNYIDHDIECDIREFNSESEMEEDIRQTKFEIKEQR